MSPRTRKAVAEDAEQLAKLAEETFRATFSADNSVADMDLHCEKNFSREIQLREIQDPDMVSLVCECDGVLVGFTQVAWHRAPGCVAAARYPGEILRLYVTSDFHGRGIAQLLMAAALEEIAQRGSDIAWLGVWEKNPRAISFYTKFDFIEVGDHEFCLGTDRQRDVIMSREIKTTSL